MKKLVRIVFVLFTTVTIAQAGHIMQGVGAVNMSMGGAATAMPLDVNGALMWNPAGLSEFSGKILDFNIGAFFSSPELSSSLPAGMLWSAGDLGPGTPASPPVSGTTYDDKGTSPMPAIAFVWGKEESRSTFGASIYGISGFGTDFPQETNLPMDENGNPNPDWDPNNSNPISWPQSMGGFGHVSSNYMLMQISLTWAFEITDNLSIGIQPNLDYAALELAPNPLSSPSMTLGYPESDTASSIGYGAQFGMYYASDGGVKLGISYKTAQSIGDLEFSNTYLDGSAAPDVSYTMDYPAIISFGVGYSTDKFDITADYRNVDYSNTDGFSGKGWSPTGSVEGFGWKDVNILSAGLQLKLVKNLPIRFGYTYSSNPIDSELAFFSIPATAVIKNAFQFGLGYNFSEKLKVNGVFHYGTSGGKTEGNLLNPMLVSPTNPYGAIPGSTVGYEMTTSMVMVGFSYDFAK